MNAFLWYKIKMMLKPKKVAGMIICPVIYVALNTAFGAKAGTVLKLSGLAIPLIYTQVLFSAGDLFRINCYVAAGKKAKDLWIVNMLVTTVAGLAASVLTTFAGALVYRLGLKETLDILAEVPIFATTAAFLIGLSTIHYRNYSKFEVIFASVIAVLNTLFFFAPLLELLIPVELPMGGAAIVGALSLAGIFVLKVLMGHNDNETLILNAMREVSAYDRMLLGLDD
ncbi:MAG: hypothetical protein K6F63_03370 [Lachnospiraceae bacterium]|nr:hypothetical protein [Lachnospiraceae bacterium]